MTPLIKNSVDEFVPEVLFLEVDVDKGSVIYSASGIKTLPAIQFIKKKEKAGELTGVHRINTIINEIKKRNY